MTQPMEPRRIGDVLIAHNGDGNPTVVDAPPLARVGLAALMTVPYIDLDEQGINIAGQVWYLPLEVVGSDSLTLLCQKVRDLRPLVAQAKEEVARR